ATIKKMLSFSVPDWWLIAIGFIFLIGAAVGEIFLPLYTGRIITAIVAPEKNDQFLTIIFEIAMISVAVSICTGLRGGVMTYYIDRLNLRIRNALFSSILHQEIGFFDEQRTGDITSRLTSDTTTMSDTIGLEFNVFLRSMIKGVGVCVFMFALSWRMSLITFMGFPLIFSASKVYGKYYKKTQKQVQDKFAKANEVAQEVCSSMQTVRSFANEKSEAAQYKLRLKDVLKIQIKQAVSYSFYQWCTESFELLLIVFTLWYGGYLIVMGKLPSANFISFILYQEELGNCFSEIGDVYTGIMQALGAAEKVFELIERKPLLSLNDGTEEPSCIKGHIAFKNVSFAYPSRPDQLVLENLSFEVQPGEVVALVGPSGGGKSSCVKLIQRFYEPTAGEIMLDGISVSSYKHQFLHEKVSLVGQEPVLYARSIRKNIIYGLEDDQYTDESILNASKLANSHNFIMELRDGYNTESGEKGIQLSGGQKQRVAIARALVRNPSVLLLDEATSALDTESEYLVQEALERSKSHRTVLLIAHRLSTVERADRIVVIVKGKVEEIGSHSELMAKQGTYYNLVYRTDQSKDENLELNNDDNTGSNLMRLRHIS
uniref:ABC-type oligopeptide transporter ABCB9 n=1 Tax=Ciona savignyi TaxID=51511 RepID=H2Z4F0_CIOSA